MQTSLLCWFHHFRLQFSFFFLGQRTGCSCSEPACSRWWVNLQLDFQASTASVSTDHPGAPKRQTDSHSGKGSRESILWSHSPFSALEQNRSDGVIYFIICIYLKGRERDKDGDRPSADLFLNLWDCKTRACNALWLSKWMVEIQVLEPSPAASQDAR